MAAGPAPAQQRRRRNEPLRGEWQDLDLNPRKAAMPPLPGRKRGTGPWPARTRRSWEAWRWDPSAQLWTKADKDYALETIYLVAEDHARMDAGMAPTHSSEIRLRLDALGLTPKGKRDLRYRLPAAGQQQVQEQPSKPTSASKRRAHLTAVE